MPWKSVSLRKFVGLVKNVLCLLILIPKGDCENSQRIGTCFVAVMRIKIATTFVYKNDNDIKLFWRFEVINCEDFRISINILFG